MDKEILCTLLTQRIDPIKFQLRGLDIFWLEEPTVEDLKAAQDVLDNYKTLEAEYLVQQEKETENAAVKAKLLDIDIKSIRSMREWVAQQATAPQYVKDFEAEAVAERVKLFPVVVEEKG